MDVDLQLTNNIIPMLDNHRLTLHREAIDNEYMSFVLSASKSHLVAKELLNKKLEPLLRNKTSWNSLDRVEHSVVDIPDLNILENCIISPFVTSKYSPGHGVHWNNYSKVESYKKADFIIDTPLQ